jgi:hypothetical protein
MGVRSGRAGKRNFLRTDQRLGTALTIENGTIMKTASATRLNQ